jgi:hypothetical protein
MTPKEKALELCNKFLRTYKVSLFPPYNMASQEAKECALIAVDEIIKFGNQMGIREPMMYWHDVIKEINNL